MKLEQNEETTKFYEAMYGEARADFLNELRFMVEHKLIVLPDELKALHLLMESRRLDYIDARMLRYA